MNHLVTTFPQESEFAKARDGLDALGLPYEIVSPEPAYAFVGAPVFVMPVEARMALAEAGCEFVSSGWVERRGRFADVPPSPPQEFDEDVFGRAAVMILASCTADETKIRIIAHLSGDLRDVLPYLNAEMPEASYNPAGHTLTYMEGYRLITLFPSRIAVAKADDIVDAWRVLESVRMRANDAWARRSAIAPSYLRRRRPYAIEIFKRLPGTNCGECGFQTCLAFAMRVQLGHADVGTCAPVFRGEFTRLKEALLEVCEGVVEAS